MRRVTLICLALLLISCAVALEAKDYTISGYVKTAGGKAISGVIMSGLPGDPTTNDRGYYKATVPRYWFGTVTPTKDGYIFSPASKSYSFVRANKKQDYTGTAIVYKISGYVKLSSGKAISGVRMSGLPGNPSTNTSGYYEAKVEHGWDGTVSPEKDGYAFSPSSRSYRDVDSNLDHDYEGRLLTYKISGYVKTGGGSAISGVRMSGLTGNPSTNSSGYYEADVVFGWDGTVTPQKDGYSFDPISKSYSNVSSDKKNQNYTGTMLTHTISGYVMVGSRALQGVTMTGLPGNPLTRSDGFYSAEVDHGWDGTVTPQKTGYTFSPASKTFSDVTGNKSQNFDATLLTYTISGYVKTADGTAMEGVRMSGLPGNPTTNSEGFYTATVDHGWNGTVTPGKTGYSFSPASKSYSNVNGNQSQNYTGALLKFTISGYVKTGDGTALQGVSMSGLPGDPSTNNSGFYTATVTYGWDGTVEPGKTGYTFSPETKSYNDVTGNQSQDYTATLLTYTISGHVLTGDDEAIEGVIMTGLPGSPSTNAEGYYSATVDHGWSGTVTPNEPFYDMDPKSRKYTGVTGNKTGDYTATLIPFLLVSESSLLMSYRVGDQHTVEVTSNVEWEVTLDADWLTVSPMNGSGFVEMAITSSMENEEFIPRVAEVTISGDGLTETIEVTQLGAQLKLRISKTTVTLGPDSGANDFIDIDSNIDWTVASDIEWLDVSPLSGSGDDQVLLATASENPEFQNRTDSITIEGAGFIHSVVVVQNGLQALLEILQPGSDLAADSGSTVEFSISSNTSWIIDIDAPWLSCSPSSGNGDATLVLQADSANTMKQSREAMITVSSGNIMESFTITQLGLSTKAISGVEPDLYVIYPNPAHERIFLRSSAGLGADAVLEIYDMSGRLIHLQECDKLQAGEPMEVDISGFTSGMYKMVIGHDGEKKVLTFIKER